MIEADALGRYMAALRARLSPHTAGGAIRAAFASWLVTGAQRR